MLLFNKHSQINRTQFISKLLQVLQSGALRPHHIYPHVGKDESKVSQQLTLGQSGQVVGN